jgi:riboflavin-specific deaminase-like protein
MVPLEKLLAGAQEHRSQTGRPLVTLSYAASLDGCIAGRAGEKLALSGPESMRMTHHLRALNDAILVGIGTLLADDPRLTVRLVQGQDPQPILLDSHLKIPLEAGLLQNARRPWIACLEDADPKKSAELEAQGADLLHIAADSAGCVSAPALLERLARLEINSLMVEGGARVISTFLQYKLVDRIVLTVAPVFLGGLRAVGQEVFTARSDPLGLYPRLQEMGVEQLGSDLVVWGNLNTSV